MYQLNFKFLILLYSICALILISIEGNAEIIKCIDESGTIKYQENECNTNDKSTTIELKNHPSEAIPSKDKIKTFTKQDPPKISQSHKPQDNYLKQRKKLIEKKCTQLRIKLSQQEKKLQQRCENGHNTYCDSPAMTLDRNLNQFYTTDRYGYDTNKYTYIKIDGKVYKGVETPLLKIIHELQVLDCAFKMPN